MPVLCHALAAFCGREARPETGPHWYAVHTKNRAEFQVRDRLAARGIPVFFPSIERPSQRSNRRITVTRPLFLCYLFAKGERRELVGVTGVAHVSGPLAEADLEEIRRAAAGEPVRGVPVRSEGEAVTIAHGPFAGITGVITRARGSRRLIIRTSILGRACAVEIGAGDVFGGRRHSQRVAA